MSSLPQYLSADERARVARFQSQQPHRSTEERARLFQEAHRQLSAHPWREVGHAALGGMFAPLMVAPGLAALPGIVQEGISSKLPESVELAQQDLSRFRAIDNFMRSNSKNAPMLADEASLLERLRSPYSKQILQHVQQTAQPDSGMLRELLELKSRGLPVEDLASTHARMLGRLESSASHAGRAAGIADVAGKAKKYVLPALLGLTLLSGGLAGLRKLREIRSVPQNVSLEEAQAKIEKSDLETALRRPGPGWGALAPQMLPVVTQSLLDRG